MDIALSSPVPALPAAPETPKPAVTMQDLFDRAVTAVILQGRRSVGSAGCAYRSPEGLKCAVGHLITDAVYDAFGRQPGAEHTSFGHPLEGKLCAEAVVQDALAESLGARLDQRTIGMLAYLQQAHDDVDHGDQHDEDGVRAWRNRFREGGLRVACVYGLSPTAIYTAEAAAAARMNGG